MIAVWMLYASAVTAVLALVGSSLERIADAGRWPRRIGWTAVTLIALLLSAAVAARRVPPASAQPFLSRGGFATTAGRLRVVPAPDAIREPEPRLIDRIGALPAELGARLQPWDGVLILAWGAGALGLSIAYAVAAWVLARRRRQWVPEYVDGVPVLVAADDGPAVIGVVHPLIVLPRWMLALDPAARALLLRHEREHVLRHDPLLMHAATLAVVLMPWNPAMWWMHRRLRLAIELDCDTRVLAATTTRSNGESHHVARYGELLLAVASRRSRQYVQVVPAFLEHNSSLSRRISAMCAQPLHRPRLQGAVAASAAAALLLVAANLPAPRLNAQEPGEPSVSRVIGSPASSPAPTMSRGATRELLQRYFPDVLRGEGPESVVFLRNASGRVVGTIPMQVAERIIGVLRTEMNRSGSERERETAAPEHLNQMIERPADGREASRSPEARRELGLRTEPRDSGPRAAEERQLRGEVQLREERQQRERELQQPTERQLLERRNAETAREERRTAEARTDDSNRREPVTVRFEPRREPGAEMTADQRRMAERVVSADIVRHGAGEVAPRAVRVLFLTIRDTEERR